MRFEIHGEDKSGQDDFVIIEGETIEEIQSKAKLEVESRGWINCYSDQLDT